MQLSGRLGWKLGITAELDAGVQLSECTTGIIQSTPVWQFGQQ